MSVHKEVVALPDQRKTANQAVDVASIAMPSIRLTDDDIVHQIRSGDMDAYGSIVRRYNQRLFRMVRSIVINNAAAMDVVQETHIKAFTKLDEYRGPNGFFSWLGKIAHNEALMHLRKYKKEALLSDHENDFTDEAFTAMNIEKKPQARPDDLLENHQLKAALNESIDLIPQNFRTVFVLRSIEQLSVRETATILGIKEITVKTRYFRAKRLLRKHIQAHLESARSSVYEFGGHHCDMILLNVLSHIHSHSPHASSSE